MVDKKLYDQDLDFRDDLDLNNDLNLDDYEDDNLLNERNEVYEEHSSTAPLDSQQSQGFVDFIKSYGIIIVIFMAVGYFGLKYSFGILNNNSSSDAATEDQALPSTNQIPADNSALLPAAQNDLAKNPIVNATNGPDEPIIPGIPSGANTTAPAVASEPLAIPPIASGNSPANSGDTANKQQLGDLDAKIVAIGQSIESINKMIAVQKNTTGTVEDLKKQVADMSAKIGTQTDVVAMKDQIQKFMMQQEQLLLYVQGVGKALGQLSDLVKKQQVIVSSFVSSNIGTPVTKESGQAGLLVEAMISDRAWLKTVSGQAFSVTIGDKIPGYGKVTKIDLMKGELITDSGMVLTQ